MSRLHVFLVVMFATIRQCLVPDAQLRTIYVKGDVLDSDAHRIISSDFPRLVAKLNFDMTALEI
jgi:hypothetical protein